MLANRRALLDPDPQSERITAIHVKKVGQYPVIGKEFKSYGLQVQGVEIPCRTWHCKALSGKKFRYFQLMLRIDETERVKLRFAHRYTPVITPGGKEEITGFIQELQIKNVTSLFMQFLERTFGYTTAPGGNNQIGRFLLLVLNGDRDDRLVIPFVGKAYQHLGTVS